MDTTEQNQPTGSTPAAATQDVTPNAAQTASQTAANAAQNVANAAQSAANIAQSATVNISNLQQQAKDILGHATNQPAVTGDEKLWGLISYIPMLAILALVLKPQSAYIKLHGRQGLMLFILFFLTIFIYLFPFIGPLFGGLIHFALIIIGVFSMYQALIGNWWKIPVLGDISELIPVDLFVKVTREAVMGPKQEDAMTQGQDNTSTPAQQ